MIDLSFFNEYLVLIVVGVCVCIGYVIKTSCPTIDNKYIPLVMAILGVFLNSWLNYFTINPEILLGGLVSGLSSTGLHQVFKNIIQPK